MDLSSDDYQYLFHDLATCKEKITIIEQKTIHIVTFIAQSRKIQRRHPSGRHMKNGFPFPYRVSLKIPPLHHRHHGFPINIRRKGIQKISATLTSRKTQPRRRLSGRQANTISACRAAMFDSAFARVVLPL
jgi:hypothetical protein